MNAKQALEASGRIAGKTSEFIAYDHRAVTARSIANILTAAIATILGGIVMLNYTDWKHAIEMIPVMEVRQTITKAQVDRMPEAIAEAVAAARPDPFTGSEGKMLDMKIDRLGDKVDRNTNDIRMIMRRMN